MKKSTIAILAVLAAFALFACTPTRVIEVQVETTEPPAAPEEDPEPVETAPPTTATPVTTAPPVDEPFTYCDVSGPGISGDTALSSFTPDDWDEYCTAFAFGYYYNQDDPEVCEEFWDTADADILDLFMSTEGGSNSFSAAVGLVDALWAVC